MDIISLINQTAFYIGAIFVAASCIVYMHIHNSMDKPQTKIFNIALWITIFTSVLNVLTIYVSPYCSQYESARITLYASNYMYFVLHNMLGMFLCYYSFFATQTFTRMTPERQTFYLLPFLISEFFIITNPWNHYTWYYDESFQFHRNWAEISVYAVGGLYYIIAIYYLIFRWYAATRKRKLMLVMSFIMTAIGIVIQFFFAGLEVELFFEAITFLGIMLSVEYDDERVDMVTRMYNREAFVQDVSYYLDTKTRFDAVLLKLTNCDTYEKMPGAFSINEVFSSMASAIRRIYKYSTCYRATQNSIILLVLNKDEAYADMLAEELKQLLITGLGLPKKDERITGVIMQTKVPDEVSSVQDILLFVDMEYNDITANKIAKGDDLHEFFERARIEKAMREGLENHRFEVLYQPVYRCKDKRINSAEALIRLNDPVLGQLLPEHFIPAAERNGMIDVISDFVLREVCRFIKGGGPDKLGIKYINVNLSVLQCMQTHFVDRVRTILKEEDVGPGRINFEIIESVAAEDYGNLSKVIRECRELGFYFSMEGYGTGYSNIYSVFSMNFNEIKLDKTILWEACISEQGRIILENSVRMIHEMGISVVAVGVETPKQLEMVEKLDVELVQGFYFAKPLSKDNVMRFAGGDRHPEKTI